MFPRPVIAKLPAICSALRHKLSARRKATEAVYFPPARPNLREELRLGSGSPGLHSAKGAAVQGDRGPQERGGTPLSGRGAPRDSQEGAGPVWWVGLLTGGPTARGGFGEPLLTTQFQAVASGVAPAVTNSCPRSRAGERGCRPRCELDLALRPSVLRVERE